MDNKPLYLLLADDDEDDCFFFKDALNELPVSAHLTAVHDGEQLMQLLTKTSSELPHILFLDLNMPRKSGYECLTEIKSDESLKQLPVIILSTYFDQLAADRLYACGAQYCMRKPAAIAQLKVIIQQALTLIAQQDGLQPAKEDFILNG